MCDNLDVRMEYALNLFLGVFNVFPSLAFQSNIRKNSQSFSLIFNSLFQ